eukprot:2497250-Pleurochrysis_carterae.AAC.3
MTSVCGPQSPGDEDEFARGTPSRLGKAQMRRVRARSREGAAVPLALTVGGGHEATATADDDVPGVEAGRRRASQLAKVRVGPHSNIERRSGIKMRAV